MIEPRVIVQRNKLNRVKRTPRPSLPALLVLHAPHARKRPPFEFSLVLCLSRACLGKYSALGTNGAKDAFLPVAGAAAACDRLPLSQDVLPRRREHVRIGWINEQLHDGAAIHLRG